MKKAGDECPYCKRVLTKSWQATRDRERKENIKLSMAIMRYNGKRPGPPLVLDISKAKKLRGDGLSVRKIAKILNVSSSTVHRHTKDAL